MQEQITLQTPSEILVQRIVARFIHEGLATEDFSEDITKIILSPSPTAEDWQLLVERILELKSRKE